MYLRARFYASQIGRFTSRDTWDGDIAKPASFNAWLYSYANPTNYADPSGLIPIPCAENQTARLCVLAQGGYLDVEHFKAQKGMAQALIEQLLPERYGKRFAQLPLSGLIGDIPIPREFHWLITHYEIYFTNMPAEGLLHDTLIGVALAIQMDYSFGFEAHQGLDPRCWSIFAMQQIGQQFGHCSSFSNEDLPSNYLGFVSAAKGIAFNDIVSALGGGEQAGDLPVPEYWGNSPFKWYGQSVRCALGDCGQDTPLNDQCTRKVQDPISGEYNNVPWPSLWMIYPTGFGTYWGKSLADFAVPAVPTPARPGAQGTLTPK